VRDDVPDVPRHEQWLCVGAALMNFMGERLADWVIAGRPVRAAHPKAGSEASPVISGWRIDQA